MNITFASPEWLIAIPIVLVLIFLTTMSRQNRKYNLKSLLIFLIAIFSLFIALTDPMLRRLQSKSAAKIALIDVSSSVDEAYGDEMLRMLRSYDNEIEVLPFASERAPFSLSINEYETYSALRQAFESLDQSATDIFQPILEQTTKNYSTVFLLSDGFHTEESDISSLEQASDAFRLYPLLPEKIRDTKSGVEIGNVTHDLVVQQGKSTDINISLENNGTVSRQGTLSITQAGRELFNDRVEIGANSEKVFTFQSSKDASGIEELVVQLSIENQLSIYNRSYISTEKREKIVILSERENESSLLKKLLGDSGYQTEYAHPKETDKFIDDEAIAAFILNNVSKKTLSAPLERYLTRFVEQEGGGLLLLGGDRSYGLGGYIGSVLEKLIPLTLVPPRAEQVRVGAAVQLVIDKSGSMAVQKRMDFAKEAARAVIRNLKDTDFVGLIGFDTQPFLLVPIDSLSRNRKMALDRVMRLYPTKSTNLYPALQEARRGLERTPASRKHMIVLTDGKLPDEGGHYFDLISAMRGRGITLSTVLIGSEGQNFIRQMADLGGGSFYLTNDPSNLPQIFLQDVKVSTGEQTMREEAEYEVRESNKMSDEFSKGRNYPSLLGYVETGEKEGAVTELLVMSADSAKPLLASWQKGEGRVVAFASDLQGRWSAPWIRWRELRLFFEEMLQKTIGVAEKKTNLHYQIKLYQDAAKQYLELYHYEKLDTGALDVTVLSPDGQKNKILFEALAEGRLRTELPVSVPGKYTIEGTVGEKNIAPAAFYLDALSGKDRQGEGINRRMLVRVAEVFRGNVNPPPEEIATMGVVYEEQSHALQWLFLILSIGLFTLHVYFREQ